MNNYDDIKRFKEKLNMEDIDYKEIAENNPHNTSHNWAILKQIVAADEPFHPLEQGLTTQPVPMPVSNKEFTSSVFDKPATLQSPPGARKNDAPPVQEQSFNSPLMAAVSKVLSTEHGPGYTTTVMPSIGFSPLTDSGRGQQASRPSILDGVGRGLPVAGPGDTHNAQRGQSAAGPSIFDSIGRQEPAVAPTQLPHQNTGRGQPAAVSSIFDGIGRREPAVAQSAPDSGRSQPAPIIRPPSGLTPSPAPANEMRFNKLFNRKSQLTTGVLPGRDMPLSLLLENIALCR